MALSIVRQAFLKQSFVNNWLTSKCRVLTVGKIQVATLKATHGEKYPYTSNPWPYKTKKLNFLNELFDIKSSRRLCENSKVICVEGNIGVGKKDFAQRLAKEFDLHYIPPVHDDTIFSHDYGYDMRTVDYMLSDNAKCYDVKRFLSDPNPEKGTVGRLQTDFMKHKLFAYGTGLLHLLSTGQGIVCVRSPYSDDVFVEAFRKLGWVSRDYVRFYNTIVKRQNLCEFLHPHITVYLDASVETCMERIQARQCPREVGGEKNLQRLLPVMEAVYKQSWLKRQRRYGEVVEVDWTEIGDDNDVNVIAEELAHFDLENRDLDDLKFREWVGFDEEDKIANMRFYYSSCEQMGQFLRNSFPLAAPEAMLDGYAQRERELAYQKHAGFSKQKGSAKELGYNKLWSFR